MVAPVLFVLATAAAASAASLSEDQFFTSLLKRQEPGTPAFDCHSNCGTAITLSKEEGDICSNNAFVDAYEACLACAGPDNVNIWRYYGRTLGAAGEKCGFSTEPATGAPSSTPAPEPSSTPAPAPSSVASTPAVPTGEPVETPEPTSEGAPEPTSEAAPETTGYEAPESVVTSAPVSIPSSSAEVVTYVTASLSNVPTPSGNGTGTFTSAPPAEFTGSAVSNFQFPQMVMGAAVVGALYWV